MSNLDPSFWQAIYEAESRLGWDLNRPTPLLSELLELTMGLGLAVGPTVAVPGCGFGHDAAGLNALGFQVTGLDFAPAAILGAQERYGDQVLWRLEDWFAPSETVFEMIFDHTCFVAMDPPTRARYIAACARRLQPQGLWLGAFFHTVTGETCPPFSIPMEELRKLAEPWFEILYLGPATRSHPKRAGREFLVVARKRVD